MEVGRETREDCWPGFTFWGLDSQRKASSGSWGACFPKGLPEVCLLTVCGRE